MIIDAADLLFGATLTADLVVVGAGPGGIVTALEAARRGVDVIVIETGRAGGLDQRAQQLSMAADRGVDVHAPVELAVGRRIGGTSSMWGGRCVPYDPVDFAARRIAPDSTWPITYEELAPYFGRACEWAVCGRPVFTAPEAEALPPQMIAGLEDGDVLTSSLERWSLPTDFGRQYAAELDASPSLRLVAGATCVRVVIDEASGRATKVLCRTLSGVAFAVHATNVVLAAGGLETTRLLMCSTDPRTGGALGDHSGHLGRWYMAHLEGVIADLEITPVERDVIYDYERDADGSYVRRRFTFSSAFQHAHELPNIAGWIANPELSDAAHGSADLSFTYLALVSPLGKLLAPDAQRLSLTGTRIPGAPYGTAARSAMWRHVVNLVRHPLNTLRFVVGFGAARVFSRGRKPPGFFVHQSNGIYPFQYHAEHLPNPNSKVTLSAETDELGMRRLDIDIRFADADADGVVRAHELWDDYLRRAGVGRLRLYPGDASELVRARSGGGFHQIGTTRMAASAADGVVDEDLAVHGSANVHVVSSSTFVTSGQANSTFMIVVFALRLTDHLYGQL